MDLVSPKRQPLMASPILIEHAGLFLTPAEYESLLLSASESRETKLLTQVKTSFQSKGFKLESTSTQARPPPQYRRIKPGSASASTKGELSRPASAPHPKTKSLSPTPSTTFDQILDPESDRTRSTSPLLEHRRKRRMKPSEYVYGKRERRTAGCFCGLWSSFSKFVEGRGIGH
jgi:hypothetical protein